MGRYAIVTCLHVGLPITLLLEILLLRHFAEFKLFKQLRGGEDGGVDDAGHGEGAAHDGADRRQEVVKRRPVLVVPHSDRVQVVPAIRNGESKASNVINI